MCQAGRVLVSLWGGSETACRRTPSLDCASNCVFFVCTMYRRLPFHQVWRSPKETDRQVEGEGVVPPATTEKVGERRKQEKGLRVPSPKPKSGGEPHVCVGVCVFGRWSWCRHHLTTHTHTRDSHFVITQHGGVRGGGRPRKMKSRRGGGEGGHPRKKTIINHLNGW